MMNSSLIPSSLLLGTLLSLYILAISLLSTSLALPASANDLLSNSQYHHIIKTRSAAQRYCGNNIVNILSLLCDGNYFSPSKRNSITKDVKQNKLDNGVGTFWDDMTPHAEYKQPEDGSSDYFIEPKRAFSLLNGDSNASHFNRNRRGIVEECCKKACTLRELYSYCDIL